MVGVLKVPVPALDECWALDVHWDHDLGGRTAAGDLVYRAKYEGDGAAEGDLVDRMAGAVRLLTGLKSSLVALGQVMIGVPGVGDGASQLPARLAHVIAGASGMTPAPDLVHRIAQNQKAKFAAAALHQQVVTGDFECVGGLCAGTVVVVIDDMVQTGATFSEVGRVLRRSGAVAVIGLAGTKVDKGMAT